MGKKKAVGKFGVGTRVRVKSGITVPEFPGILCEGWTGSVSELIGKNKPDPRYVIHWDESTVNRMPSEYRDQCESKGLLYEMACLSGDDLEPIDS